MLDGLTTKELNTFIRAQPDTMVDLARIIEAAAKLGVFDYIHAATAVTKAGHLLKEEKSKLESISSDSNFHFAAVVRVARPFIGKMQTRHLANFIWALGCSCSPLANVIDHEILEELIEASKLTMDEFSAQALSNTAWSLAAMGHDDPDFTSQLLAAAIPKLQEFAPQDFSNMVYALAKQKGHGGAPNPGDLDLFLKEFVVYASAKLESFQDQPMRNTFWALFVLGYHDLSFQQRARAAFESKKHMFSPRDRVKMRTWIDKLA